MKNSYMLKRIFIGVAIGTILMFIRGCDVFALEPFYMYGGVLQTCNALYNNNSSSYGGTTTYETGTFGSPYFRCQYSPFDYSLKSNYQFFQLVRTSMGSGAPKFELNKKYRLVFYAYTQRQVPMTIPNNLNQFKIIQSGVAGTIFTSLDSALDCNVELESQTYDNDVVNRNKYKITCDNFSVTSTTWSRIYLYANLDNAGAPSSNNTPWLYLFYIGDTGYYEEYVTNVDINNSINDVNNSLMDDNVAIPWDSNTSQNYFNQFTDVNNMFGLLFNMPVYILQRVRNRLVYADDNVSLTIEKDNLPLSSYINYDNDVVIPPLRQFIYNLIGENWYETIGGIFGGIIILKLLFKIGRRLLDMWTFYDTHDDIWGGIN